MNLVSKAAITVATVMTIATAPAHAYIDPAASSMALQALVGGLVTLTLFGKMWIARIRALFTGRSADTSADSKND